MPGTIFERQDRFCRQVILLIEGMGGLTKGLFEVIEENGGEIRTNCEVQEIVIRDNKAFASFTADRIAILTKMTIRGQWTILDCSLRGGLVDAGKGVFDRLIRKVWFPLGKLNWRSINNINHN